MLTSRIKGIVLNIEGVPTLPAFVQQLLHTIYHEDFTAQDLEKIIQQDPPMSSRLLRIANSSFFGQSGKIGTLDRAIVLLGVRYILALAVSFSMVITLPQPEDEDLLRKKDYWIHSFACAMACQRLVELGFFPQVKEESFLCGLLHDLGKLILWIYQPEAYREVVGKIRKERWETYEAELEVLGYHHGHVGSELAKWWKLPQKIQGSAEFHHDENPENLGARLVQLADQVAHRAGYCDGLRRRYAQIPISKELLEGSSPELIEMLISDLKEQPQEIQEVVQILHSETNEGSQQGQSALSSFSA